MARSSRGAGLPLQPLPAAAVAAALRGARRLDQVLALCHCAAEAWTFCSAPAGSSSRYAAQALLLTAQAALLAFFLRASWGRWRRYRTWAIGAMRLVAVAHAPLLYGPQEGLGQLLHKPASPGALGAAADWFRVIAGLLPSAFVGMACRLPPAAALVQQAAVVNGTTLAEASAVSPLLCFRDVAHEAAAVACMQRRYAHNDWKLFAQGSTCLFFLFLRVQQAGHWAPGVLAECVMLLALLLLSLRYHETFIRWRSVLISAVYLIHSLVTRTTTPMVFGPSCPHVATFFLREFNISQAFWLALICTAHPVPLKHAVWSQGAAVASMLAYLPQLRANAIVRCAASEQHYLQAARALTVVASSVFPSPLGSQVLKLPQQLGPTGAFYAMHLAVLLGSFLVSLAFLFRFELAHRRTYARQHRLTAEAAALLHRKRQLEPRLPLLLLLCAVGWIACCCTVLLCFKVTDLVR